MLGLWGIGRSPNRIELHVAMAAALEEVLRAPTFLRERGVTPLSFFGEETDEPSVISWLPAAALYCRDPDGHLLEYLARLDDPAAPDRGVVSWSDWIG
jgi:lactoylglutathione lyase